MDSEPDDIDLAVSLGLMEPAERKPEKPPYADFDPEAFAGLSARERFGTYADLAGRLEAERRLIHQRFKREYAERLEETWRAVKPRGKRAFDLAKAEAELGATAGELANRYVAKAKASEPAFEKLREAIETLVRCAADECRVESAETAVYFADSYPSSYNSQTNPHHYAKVKAELTAFEVRACGVRAEVREQGQTEKLPYFVVWVYAAERDVPVLRKKSGPRMAEIVRECWRLGSNPRVYWPFLPHGFEERNGFGFDGRDLPTAEPPTLAPTVATDARAIEIGLDFEQESPPLSLADLNATQSSEAEAEEKPSLPSGWAWPENSKRAHYFTAGDLKSLCGKWAFGGDRSETNHHSPDNCAECKRRRDKMFPEPEVI